MFAFIRDIVVNHGDIVFQFDASDEGIEEPLAKFLVVYVAALKAQEPRFYLALGQPGAFYFCPLYFKLKLPLLVLQRGKARCKTPRPGLLDSVEDVALAFTTRVELFFKSHRRIIGEIYLLYTQNLLRERGDRFVREHILHRRREHGILEQFFSDGFSLTFAAPLLFPALVIIIFLLELAAPALAVQHRAAISAKAFTRQHKISCRPSGGVAVMRRRKVIRAPQEKLLVNDRLDAELYTGAVKNTEVSFIAEHSVYDRH